MVGEPNTFTRGRFDAFRGAIDATPLDRHPELLAAVKQLGTEKQRLVTGRKLRRLAGKLQAQAES